MHIAKTNAQQDEVALQQLVQQKPLGTWSTVANGAIVVNHVPFLFKPEQGEQGAPLEAIEPAIATFEADIPVVIDAQIYTHYKADWCALSDGIPVFKEGRE